MTAPTAIPVSVIMPAYNEEGGIQTAVAAVQEHVLSLVPGAEVVVVNDGSRDRTGALADAIADADPRVRVLHTPNGGHGTALMRGLADARGEYMFLIDGDNQIPIESFQTLWTVVQNGGGRGLDGVFGTRRARNDAYIRRALTAFIGWSLIVLFRIRIKDANVPYKLVRRTVWEDARRYIPDGTLAPSLFLAVYMKRKQCDLAFVNVSHRDREAGEVSIRRWKLIKFCARGFRQLMEFRHAIRDL
ncbi:MAG: family 2 glycosyl transferase [Gemmatimonadetes bacterium]|nr:family 2 glycosyl transferase [Gemmatimonadota bacterium]